MKSRSSCFLNSPEWQSLLSKSPSHRSQLSEIPSLRLRFGLHILLTQIPDLIVEASSMSSTQAWEHSCNDRLDFLLNRVSKVFCEVKNWLMFEAEPQYFSYDTSSSQFIDEHVNYPDMISGVLDSVANTALLILDRMYCSLHHTRLGESSIMASGIEPRWVRNQCLLDNPGDVERRRLRVIRAFEYVRGESTLAAKPLEFGLREAQSRN